MVGGKGRGKGVVFKLKCKVFVFVFVVFEFLNMEDFVDSRLDGEEKINEILDNGEKLMDEEGRDDIVCGLVIDNGYEE